MGRGKQPKKITKSTIVTAAQPLLPPRTGTQKRNFQRVSSRLRGRVLLYYRETKPLIAV
jgi:hypothetical protein